MEGEMGFEEGGKRVTKFAKAAGAHTAGRASPESSRGLNKHHLEGSVAHGKGKRIHSGRAEGFSPVSGESSKSSSGTSAKPACSRARTSFASGLE
jgi:hypothetical protein